MMLTCLVHLFEVSLNMLRIFKVFLFFENVHGNMLFHNEMVTEKIKLKYTEYAKKFEELISASRIKSSQINFFSGIIP